MRSDGRVQRDQILLCSRGNSKSFKLDKQASFPYERSSDAASVKRISSEEVERQTKFCYYSSRVTNA
uniref:Uncharacterized protein n=1 Tax=Steinernema glaseri TaxID=37863 RepID=A0A1I7Y522_9BILA